MPKQATGELRWNNSVAIARITLRGKERASFGMPACKGDDEARARAALLSSVARRMRSAAVEASTARKALGMIAEASPRGLRSALALAEELVGGELQPIGAAAVPTFAKVAEMWTSGELHRLYPQLRQKRGFHDERSRLNNHILPILGEVPIDRVTLDHCEEVMRRIPAHLEVATRRNVGLIMARVLKLSVYPLRLITASPIPSGFLPANPTTHKARASLYPSEDRRLMARTSVPLAFRLLWGFLAREGMREGEALALTWGELDLERGAVRLDKNKTDDPRAWALHPGVAEALRRFKARYRPRGEPSARVFLSPDDRPLAACGLAETLRKHLREVGLDKERPELFTSTAERKRIRVHDIRGTFVTIGLANGKSEAWIADRTGHRSSAMINRYKRTARTFAELQTGELESLENALPELRDCPRIAHGISQVPGIIESKNGLQILVGALLTASAPRRGPGA